MRLQRAGALTALAGVALFVGAPACGQDCSAVGCEGNRAVVLWRSGEVPRAEVHELCVDDVCETVEPRVSTSEGGRPLSWDVGTPNGPAVDETEATVRLVLRDANGVELAGYEGRGALSDGCCAAVLMQVDGDRLVPDE